MAMIVEAKWSFSTSYWMRVCMYLYLFILLLPISVSHNVLHTQFLVCLSSIQIRVLQSQLLKRVEFLEICVCIFCLIFTL